MARMVVEDYDISRKTGFLLEDPLAKLPSYFDPWNKLAGEMAERLKAKTMRDEVLKLPLLDHTRLSGDKEVKLAHLQLVAMAAGYLWQNIEKGSSDVPKSLPKSLAVPLYGIYEKHGFAPVTTYADVTLNNWKLLDPNGGITFENVAAIVDWPGDKDWKAFAALSIMVEQAYTPAVPAIQDVLDGVDGGDAGKVAKALGQITAAVGAVQTATTKFHDHLPVEAFFPNMLRYFYGWNKDTPLPDGLVYEGVNDQPIKMESANASQTVIFKSLDSLVGIQHQKDRHDHTENAVSVLSPKHKKFVMDLRNRGKQLKPFVDGSGNADLKAAYGGLVNAIVEFRSYHFNLITKYVVGGIQKTMPKDAQDQIQPLKEFILGYLKGMRDDSKA